MEETKNRPAAAETAGWVHMLGEQHRARDECAARTAQSQNDDEQQMLVTSAERWPSIVTCLRQLAAAYNTSVQRTLLRVVESGQQTVTVAVEGEGAPSLTAVLEGNLICIHACGTGVPHTSEIRLRSDRDDHATASYLLQNWMQCL